MKTKQMTLSAMFLAIGLILPFFTGQIQTIGNQLLPMHIPVLLCSYIIGAPYGMLVGFIMPVLRSFMFGMPLIVNAMCMAFELASYGFFAGYLYKKLNQSVVGLYVSLVVSMIMGRLVWGIVSYIVLGASFSFTVFISGALLNAIPGILLQIIFIPIIVLGLKKKELVLS